MKVALYARVSTRDQQTIPMQLAAMREYADQHGWRVVAAFEEKESGKRDDRPVRRELLKEAARGKFDVVIVWKLDRWGRSTVDLLTTLMELDARSVAFVSLSEAIDLTTPVGRLMAGILSVFAQFEREMIVERVRAGVKRYREDNQEWGRPATARGKTKQILKLKEEGKNNSQIAKLVGVGRSSVIRILKENNLE